MIVRKIIILLLSIAASVIVGVSEQEIATNATIPIPIVNKSEEVTPKILVVSTNNSTNRNQFGCVPYYECDPRTRTLKNHDFDVTNMNISGCSESKKCEGRYAVCCQVFSSQAITKPNPDLGNEEQGISRNTSCVCVAYYLCNNGFVDSHKDIHIFSRRRRSSKDEPCKKSSDVCCEVADKATTFPANWTGCGHRNLNGVGRLQLAEVGGLGNDTSKFGEFPWMIAILRQHTLDGGRRQKLNIYECGGALIHRQVVVTTASCIQRTEGQLIIRAGLWDTKSKDEPHPHQDRVVSTITIHPQFYLGAAINDIALLFLKEPVTITETVDFICLPPQNDVFENTRCFVSGWGKDVFGKNGVYQNVLKKIAVPIVGKSACEEALRHTRLGKDFELHRSFICAGGEAGKDSCGGDGGSPLVCPISGLENRYVLSGMVSWGIYCGEKDIPGVYTNIALFKDWIDQEMAYNNFDWKSYQY